MMKLLAPIVVILSFAVVVQASSYPGDLEKFEQSVGAYAAERIGEFFNADKALQSLSKHLSMEDVTYLKGLIASDKWVEIPRTKAEGKSVIFKNMDGATATFEIRSLLKNEYSVNGTAINLTELPTLKEKIEYLAGIVKNSAKGKTHQANWFYSQIIPESSASVTCHSYLTNGCTELSLAVSLWMAESMAKNVMKDCITLPKAELHACRQVNLHTLKANDQFNSAFELGKVLVKYFPKTQIRIDCKVAETPDIYFNSSDEAVFKDKQFYNFPPDSDPNFKSKDLVYAVKICCQPALRPDLGINCAEFINNQFGFPISKAKNNVR